MKITLNILSLITSMALVGCATGPKSLYSWGEYPQQTYLMLSAPEKVNLQEQINKLEKDIEKARAKNSAVPPGIYAHLGLLNLNTNNGVRAAEYFELERQVYPESTILMERLLNKMASKTTGGAMK